jgi:hypothetical protein
LEGIVFGHEPPAAAEVDLTAPARAILQRLHRPTSGDELVHSATLDAGVAAALSELELAGLVATSDGVYRLTGR